MGEAPTSTGKPRLPLVPKVYKGVLMFECEAEEIEAMEIKDEDIWVCSFPRSGTTLTMELVYLIRTLDFKTANSEMLDVRFPMIDLLDERYPYYKGMKMVTCQKCPRFVKTHFHHFILPEPLRKGKGKMIYVSRNPKDVVTSFYRLLQWGDQLESDETFKTFVDDFVTGKGVYGPWSKHVLGYWERRNDPNLLFLKYEDIIKDLPATVRHIAKFLNQTLTDDDVRRICEHCHVDNMRNNDKTNLSYYRTFKHVNEESEGQFINKGKVGTWHEVLTPEMNKKVEEMFDRDLSGTGVSYKFQ